MKRGWTTAALGDVAAVVSGATPKTGVSEYWNGTIPWATPNDLSDLRTAEIHSTPRMITEAGLRSCAASILPAGSVLFSSRAPIGHVAINSVPMATNQGFKSLVPKAGMVDVRYLYHWLRYSRPYLESLGNGATFKEVSKAVVARVQLPVPPIEEQRRIASILDRADALRVRRCRLRDLLTSLTSASVASAVGRGNPDYVQLGELTTSFRNGLSPSSRGVVPGRVLTLSAVTRGAFYPSAAKDALFDRVADAEQRVRAGTLLICRGNGNRELVGAGEMVSQDYPDLIYPDTVIAAAIDATKVEPRYLWAVWRLPQVRAAVQSSAKTTNGIYKVNQSGLSSIRLPILPREQQRELVTFLGAGFSIGDQLRAAGQHMDRLFGALQVRAFSGRL